MMSMNRARKLLEHELVKLMRADDSTRESIERYQEDIARCERAMAERAAERQQIVDALALLNSG
jgi:hypothetical protein